MSLDADCAGACARRKVSHQLVAAVAVVVIARVPEPSRFEASGEDPRLPALAALNGKKFERLITRATDHGVIGRMLGGVGVETVRYGHLGRRATTRASDVSLFGRWLRLR